MDALNVIQNLIEQLCAERVQLLAQPMCPPGAWLHYYTVYKESAGEIRSYTYAKWQADEPIFERRPKPKKSEELKRLGLPMGHTNHRHVGRVCSSTNLPIEHSVIKARQEYARRQRLDEIDRALSDVLACLEKARKPISDNLLSE